MEVCSVGHTFVVAVADSYLKEVPVGSILRSRMARLSFRVGPAVRRPEQGFLERQTELLRL